MSVFNALNTSSSALTLQRLRMDVASSNIANSHTTRARIDENGEFIPYRRKMVMAEPNGTSFRTFLQRAQYSSANNNLPTGVRATAIVEDDEPFKLMYDPTHPDANEFGYVSLPNVDPLKEMVDVMGATRSYEANVTVLNASKDMLLKALEIGR